MNRGIIQKAIENKSTIMGVELRDFCDVEMTFDSELPTIADLIVPGMDRSISAELDYMRGLLISSEERR